MAAASLERLFRRFLRETGAVLLAFHEATTPSPSTPSDVYAIEMCAIRLQDSWARFCSELVILSALKEPVTRGGHRLTQAVGIKSIRDVKKEAWAMSYPKRQMPPKWEPRWHLPQVVLDLGLKLQLGNYTQIKSGISISQSPLEELRCVRNFLAHRGRRTGSELRALNTRQGLAQSTRARDLLSHLVVPGIPLFERWVHILRLMADVATL